MPRRARVEKREVLPDPKYHSKMLARFTNKIMYSGKKSTAERIVYGAMDLIEHQTRRGPLDTFDQAMRNATPVLEVKPRRVGGATYQVPVEIRGDRRISLAMRWLINYSRARSGHSMAEKLAAELLDASRGMGASVKKRDDTHKMAEANKAFAHYRW
ncbi:MAG: 30S ribosomal protein S7 [Dehalococcoidia bacterium]|nr:30S ribosomal protein S7 [Dehalococcoidia bacterium]